MSEKDSKMSIDDKIKELESNFMGGDTLELKINGKRYNILQHITGAFWVFVNFNPQKITFGKLEEAVAYINGLIDGGKE